MIPFSPPRIDQKIIDAVTETLRSGWITTGPKTKLFEKKLAEYCNVPAVLCLNSATAGLELVLRWFGVGEGDEVIIPAYTYTATANVVVHCGAKPVMVDIDDNFNIHPENIERAVTPETKVIIPVDIAGFPCNYKEINEIAKKYAKSFSPKNDVQERLERILVLSDAAHSLGAIYNGKKTGSLCDVSVFSFHAVKNLSTAEGGAVAFNLPPVFDHVDVYKYMCAFSLHGQNKDALAKMKKGQWKYDVQETGYKCNMTDIAAAMGLVELERYENDTLVKRKKIFDAYHSAFSNCPWAQLPVYETGEKKSSFHLFPLRIKNISETVRDLMIQKIFDRGVSVNVHFIPLPMLSVYKNAGYVMDDYPAAYDSYSREISLPVFYDLTDEQVEQVIRTVKISVEEVLEDKMVA